MPHLADPPEPGLCELISAELDLLEAPGVARVRIMGINALGVLNRRRGDLVALLARGGALDILLLDPESAAFVRRRDSEENRNGRVSNRLQREMEASMAIVRDILNILLNDYGLDLDNLADRYRVRLHDQTPTAARLFVDTGDDGVLLYRDLPADVHATTGSAMGHRVVKGAADGVYPLHDHHFAAVWAASNPVPLKVIESDLIFVSPEKKDLPHVNALAIDMHKKRRLDEASALYRTVLRLEGPAAPSESQIAAAHRHLPRLYTSRGEPFELKDLVTVIHPDPERRLIGYHLVWEDDIDFLDDNDPADHEVVWVRYADDGTIGGAWSYWHDRILTTGGAVADANSHGGRVRVNSQWGKHGSLLSGWQEKVGVDEAVPGYPEYETLEFSRLTKGRKPSVGIYPDRWPKRFEGSREDFLDFAVEIDMEKKLLEHEMIIVSRYANAVISQWYLPYNIRPKDDWPRDIAEPA